MKNRVYTIWPGDREGLPARASNAWRQDRYWLVLDVTDGLDRACVVEGPVPRQEALRRELELRVTARAIALGITREAL
jgi:hypothetical protein